jgi:hypothetical protein
LDFGLEERKEHSILDASTGSAQVRSELKSFEPQRAKGRKGREISADDRIIYKERIPRGAGLMSPASTA